ncbi:MAG: hypothetical protein HKN92_10140 [Chitinophagales bacterium]|nr:hypothetical protein [Chitinophagales bacterium]
MVCDDERCLPPTDVDFSIPIVLNEKKEAAPVEKDNPDKDGSGSIEEPNNKTVEADLNEKPETEDIESEILKPVEWKVSGERNGDLIDLTFKAEIEKGWYVYSQNVPPDGPVATSFHYDTIDAYSFPAPVSESGPKIKEGFDEIFGMDIKKYARGVEFKHSIKINDTEIKEIKGYFEFMTCDDSKCLPPEFIDFKINVANGEASIFDPALEDNAEVFEAEQLDLGLGYEPEEKKKSAIWVFLFGVFGGLFALLTPCVFPMIPLTVSFFTKSSGNGSGLLNAMLYGLAIFAIYVLLSAPFHLLNLAPDILNQISTSVGLNVFFFLIFVAFAISFFGYYELTMPSSLANKVSQAEGRGGLIGIFFMALTLAIVSFSCTGPIIGTLLAGTLSQGAWHLTAGMAGFGLALGLPFALFALFPSWLNNLPKSGGWMNSVKVVLGFAELALALKFLSVADLVAHWGLLKREVFFGLWIVICLLTILYLIKVIHFPHDSRNRRLGKFGIAFTIILAAFTIYLIPGLFGKNVSLISGFPPPMYYRIFESNVADAEFETNVTEEELAEFKFSKDCPYGVPCFKDFFEAERYAKQVDKPILVDFTGFGCVNCRKMEENVWPEEGILDLLGSELVLASLYVDDREALPEDQVRIAVSGNYSKKLRNVGNKWSFFQTINFKENSQPSYVILTPDREIIMEPVGYTPNPSKFKGMLNKAIKDFKDQSLTSTD